MTHDAKRTAYTRWSSIAAPRANRGVVIGAKPSQLVCVVQLSEEQLRYARKAQS